ncbi:leucyl aminopeptidase [Alkalihalobacillus xiaoxiensis]|uniref:Probable cytosol aminopeptidase n=1 Tax=Shouchella xiaoxiensis TaxID=766895 RepID=A0ABS2SVP1_9BACI|nr:leucyl aminopeptidase [Shouchella xiaoxiensis]MBM7838317.1 leucyl aminopeptidase [Shouchella xiaoxiensis]
MFSVNSNWTSNNEDDVLLVGIGNGTTFTEDVSKLDQALNGQLMELRKQGSLGKKRGELTSFYTLNLISTKKVYVLHLGDKETLTRDELRTGLGKAGLLLKKEKMERAGILLDSFASSSISKEEAAFAVGEAFALASYDKQTYKEKSNEPIKMVEAIRFYSVEEGLTQSAQRGYTYGNGTNTARKLVNIPGNMLTPTDLAEEAKTIADSYGFEFSVLEREDMEKLGMGALLAVAQGSDQPPKMIVMRYEGNPASDDLTAFVGKGLTFDSGGYSLKPPANMHEMKGDMGGAAAVLGAMQIIGEEQPKQNVLCVIPSSENLINGSAMKPGDVLRAMSGKTIEVRNTDAEGRLILADGVAYAKQLGASRLIDVATLTGACIVALGQETTGAVTNNKDLMEAVRVAGENVGEPIWQFPSSKAYKDLLKTSDVADLNNAPGRAGGSITAGLFIGEFAEDTPWVHLDIAGTSSTSKQTAIGPAGATGIMARTLAEYISNRA